MINLALKKSIIKAFSDHKEEVLHDFQEEERTRLDQVSGDDMDNKHIDSKNEETLNEMDFLTHSMEILEKELYILRSIPQTTETDRVEFGALVKTDKLVLLVGAAHEKMTVDGVDVVGVSMAAPVTRAMEGKKKGDKVKVGTIEHTIEEIC
jgi:transcription elongation GreA/GreB family factor